MEAKELGKCPQFADSNVQVDPALPLIFLTTIDTMVIIYQFVQQNRQDKNLRINVLSDHVTSRKLQKIKDGRTVNTRFINQPSVGLLRKGKNTYYGLQRIFMYSSQEHLGPEHPVPQFYGH
jgi:hypothetical protein